MFFAVSMQDYLVEKTIEGTELNREAVENISVISLEGLCIADQCEPSKPRDIESYRKNVLDKLIKEGKITNGSKGTFDERKIRFHSASVSADSLRLYFGFTNYTEFLAQFRQKDESEKDYIVRIENMKKKGLNDFREEFAYFSRAAGIAAAVITKDRKIVVGERIVSISSKVHDNYEGAIQSVHGSLDYRNSPEEIRLSDDVKRELREELGIPNSTISTIKFVGAYSDPMSGGSDFDFAHLVSIDLPSSYFTSGKWREQAIDKEHGVIFIINDFQELQNFLKFGILSGSERKWEIIYSNKAALECIKPEEIG